MSDRARAKHRKQERADRRVERWELELAAARTSSEKLTVAYRWCLAEMHREKKQAGLFGRVDADRFGPAIDALLTAARGHPQ